MLHNLLLSVFAATTTTGFVAVVHPRRITTSPPHAVTISGLLEQECKTASGSSSTKMSAVVEELAERTAEARSKAASVLPYDDEAGCTAWLLRFLSPAPGDKEVVIDVDAAAEAVDRSIEWRTSPEGKGLVEAAQASYAAATADGRWNNDPVLAAAPSSSKISPYVGPAKLLTLRNSRNDGLIYAIRAGQVDDKALMASVSAEELSDFFLYAKAVNEIVCAKMATEKDCLAEVVTVNDLSGVDIFGDASFRNALSAASKLGDKVFPGLAGPTILLNLPRLLGALVKLFTPLFPASVQKKLKFASYELSSPETFLDRQSPDRAAFLDKIDDILK